MKYEQKYLIAMAISAAAACGFFFVSYVLMDFGLFIALLITVALFTGLFMVIGPRKIQIGSIDLTDMAGGEEMEELIKSGKESLETIRGNSAAIRHPQIKAELDQIYSLGLKIFEQIAKDPTQIKNIRRFFSYYLDVTIKLIEKYKILASTSVATQGGIQFEDAGLKPAVEKLQTCFELIHDAFAKNLGRLIEKDIMDIDVETKVLESVLKEEG